ncbi:MAG: hypothetical protein SGARI_007117 [Bacillariaceae sp.]
MNVLGAKVHGYYSCLEFQQLEEQQQPVLLKDDNVLIKVHYADVNPVDLQKLAGRPDQTGLPVENPPHVPGYGGSGSYATHVVVNENCVAALKVTETSSQDDTPLDFQSAACIPVAGLTAYESLVKCGIEKKKSLLVVGGSGGVGSWTIVLAKHMTPNLHITATASTKEQQEWCKSLGASKAIPHDEIEQHLDGGREGSVDAIICLTEPTPELFASLSNAIKPYGTICLVVAGKSIESLNMGFCFFKCVNVVTETVFSSIRTGYSHIHPGEEMNQIIHWIVKAGLKVPISPKLVDGRISDKFSDALKEGGVLKAMSQPHGKMGNLVMNIHE